MKLVILKEVLILFFLSALAQNLEDSQINRAFYSAIITLRLIIIRIYDIIKCLLKSGKSKHYFTNYAAELLRCIKKQPHETIAEIEEQSIAQILKNISLDF